jgi:prevent-host-death family protein
MSTVTVTYAKENFAELAERAGAGETITITRWGKPVAELRPFSSSDDASADPDPGPDNK